MRVDRVAVLGALVILGLCAETCRLVQGAKKPPTHHYWHPHADEQDLIKLVTCTPKLRRLCL